jgi:hypothetical protein
MSIDEFSPTMLISERRSRAFRVARQHRQAAQLARFSRTLLVAAALSLIACAPEQSVEAQASPACWISGDPSEVASRASVLDSTTVVLDGDTIKVCYGRPAARGREIMGGLVPYDQPWRLGANEATAIHVPFAATIAGVSVDPGWYSIYVVPGEQEWQVVVNGEPQRWGIPIDEAVRAKDIGSGTIKADSLEKPVETFTITLRSTSATAAMMDVEWANTRVSIPVQKQ